MGTCRHAELFYEADDANDVSVHSMSFSVIKEAAIVESKGSHQGFIRTMSFVKRQGRLLQLFTISL